MRLDQWLWAVRVFKTRTNAAEAIKAGHVSVNGQPCKPSREVRAGDTVIARVGIMTRTVRVIDAPKSRVGAKLVAQFAEDLTPPEEYARRPEPNMLPPMFRPKGAGRPTKRDRRETGRLTGEDGFAE
jgi:ribosome-associated heat shock protein Hsp15